MSGDRAEKSREYWAAREKENAKRLSDRKDGYRKEIAAEYEYTRQQIEDRINAFYERYADSEGITMAEARKRVSKIDMETYERKAAKYVKEKNFSRRANEEMKLYNATMKINRLELLKAEIGLELTAEADALDKSTGDILQTETYTEYRRLAGILGMTVGSTAEEARSVAESSFKGATYSDRIWSHQEALKAEIDKKLSEAMISGRSSRDLAADLRRRFAVSQSNAERLIDTEIRRCQTGAAKAVYEKNGTDEYEFMAIGPHPCDICKPMDGKKFKVADMKPGENAPPMHPRCHCTTGPAWDEAAYNDWLDSGAAANGVNYKDFKAINGAAVEKYAATDYNDLKEKARNTPMQKIVDDFVNGKSTDRQALGERILKEYGVDGVPVNIKDMADYGYCSIRIQNGKLTVTDYNLNAGDKRGVQYQIKTAFHEAYHASGNGFSTDIDSMDQSRWLDLEETFAESSAHYMVSQYGITGLTPSYPDKLVKMLPRLKKLPEFKGCKTIADFGKIAQEARQNGGGSVWKDMSQRAMRKRFDFATYTKQYFQTIRKDVPGMIDKILENMPECKQYRKDMINDLSKAMNNVDAYGYTLSDNQSLLLNNAVAVEMGKMGVL